MAVGFGEVGGYITNMLSYVWAIFKLLPVFLGAAGLGVGIWYILNWQQYKHRIIIKQITGGKKLVQEDFFRVLDGKRDGVPGIVTRKKKEWLPYPPPDAIEITRQGRLFVQVYKTEEGAYVYSTDKGEKKNPGSIRRR